MEKLDIDHVWEVNKLNFCRFRMSGLPWVQGRSAGSFSWAAAGNLA